MYTISAPHPPPFWVYQERSKRPEPVSADPKPIAASTLGATIPYVLGTGEVDGKFFIGQTEVVSRISGYDTVEVEDPLKIPSYSSGGSGGPTGTVSAPVLFPPITRQVPIYTTETVSSVGYILAFDPFERGYNLLRLKVDGEIVYDTENGIGAGLTFRFYGGRHTTIDPVVQARLGDNASAYQNFVLLFLEGYPSESPPSVQAVISNAATDQPEDDEIDWVGAAPGIFTGETAGRQAAYDPADGLIFQLLGSDDVSGLLSVHLSVLDINTMSERYRIPLEGSSAYVGGSLWAMALRGTGHILVKFALDGVGVHRVYNASTGELVASHSDDFEDTVDWTLGGQFGSEYLFLGHESNVLNDDEHLVYALIDLVAETLTIERIDDGVVSLPGRPTYGRLTSGTTSFYLNKFRAPGISGVDEAVFDGDIWAVTPVYTSLGLIDGHWYDPETGYLIVFETVGSDHYIRYLNPDTGDQVDTIDVDKRYFVPTVGYFADGRERYWPMPGYVLMDDLLGSDGIVYLLDVKAKTVSTYADLASATVARLAIFNQRARVYYSSYGDDIWTEHQLPNSSPGLVDLEDIIKDVMSLAGFCASDATYGVPA